MHSFVKQCKAREEEETARKILEGIHFEGGSEKSDWWDRGLDEI